MTSTTRSKAFSAAKAAFPYTVQVVSRQGKDVTPVRAGAMFSVDDGTVDVFDPEYTLARITLLIEEPFEVVGVRAGDAPAGAILIDQKYPSPESDRHLSLTVRYATAEGRLIFQPVVEFRFRPRRTSLGAKA